MDNKTTKKNKLGMNWNKAFGKSREKNVWKTLTKD